MEKSADAIVGEDATDLQYQQKGMTAAYERTVFAELPNKRSRHRRAEPFIATDFNWKSIRRNVGASH